MKKVIVTGATGMVGKAVLIECLEDPRIDKVLSISRRSTGISNPKLTELLHSDFSDFSQVEEELKGYDACFASMGVSSAGMSETDYTRLTYDYTLALAKTLYKLNPEMVYTYVSGMGTDSTENGRTMWGRVKGRTENDLLKLGFKDAYAFRPGAIVPKKGVQPSSKLYRVLIPLLGWMFPIMRAISPNSVVNTDQIGLSMISLLFEPYPSKIVNPKDILILSNKS